VRFAVRKLAPPNANGSAKLPAIGTAKSWDYPS
jgi:hypothetical protein